MNIFSNIRNYAALLNTPAWEAIKEIGRWVVLFVLSWIITETLNQVELVPESATIKVWVFSYVIPVRMAFQLALTLAGRAVDKYLFAKSKEEPKTKAEAETPKGLLPF